MDEHVAAGFTLDEAVPLGVVEPLDLALNAHCLPLPCAPTLAFDQVERLELPVRAPSSAEVTGTKKSRICGLMTNT
jgi:hypothetical protein